MKVQGYVEIDHQEMTDTQREEFYQKIREYFLDFYMISTIGDREYYSCILQDDSNIPEVIDWLGYRNPILNGLWGVDGIPVGKYIVESILNSDGTGGELSIEGDATYPFDLYLHLSHTPKDISVDEEGNVTETDVIEFRPLHGFSGWSPCQAY